MDLEVGRSKSLQERLNSLSLASRSTGGNRIADHVLLGKMIAARPFKRKDLVQIINAVWRTRDRVQVERLTDFIFKFCFTTKEDRDSIYTRRPWSFNGSHMNLQLWNPEVHFHQVKFDTSTFHMQIHGLPPNHLNEDNARMIGSEIGQVHEDSISPKSVVRQRYLRFRVDIAIEEPLPAGFIQKLESGEEYWVQFKFERLADFCYKCGRVDHVTGRCKFKEHARVTMESGVTARLYGPWLRAEEKGSILFVNPATEDGERKRLIADITNFSGVEGEQHDGFHLGDGTRNVRDKGEAQDSLNRKDDSDACYHNALAMLPELEALHFTSKRQELIQEADLQEAVVSHLRKGDMTLPQLGEWAQGLLRVIATGREHENSRLRKYGPDVLEWLGTGPPQFSLPTGISERPLSVEPITKVKRQAPIIIEGVEKRSRMLVPESVEEAQINELVNDLEAVDVSDSDETPIRFHIGESTPQPTSRKGRRAWKKDARRSGQMGPRAGDNSEASASSSQQWQSDF